MNKLKDPKRSLARADIDDQIRDFYVTRVKTLEQANFEISRYKSSSKEVGNPLTHGHRVQQSEKLTVGKAYC